MKKNLFCFFAFSFLFALPLFCEKTKTVEGMLVPQEVFVGDTAVVYYSVFIPENIFRFLPENLVVDNAIALPASAFAFEPDLSASVVSARLSRNEFNYQLEITFVPWVTGSLQLEEISLNKLLSAASNLEPSEIKFGFTFTPAPLQIHSITEKLHVNTLRSSKGPLLIPGTRYVLWVTVFLLIIFFALIFVVLIHLKKILAVLKRIRTRNYFKKNEKLTRKKLNALLNENNSDSEFSSQWQNIMRNYLSVKFASPYNSVLSKDLYSYTDKITQGLLDEKKQDAVEKLMSFFIRTDYIRYAKDSLHSKLAPQRDYAASFQSEEKKNLVKESLLSITSLEEENQ